MRLAGIRARADLDGFDAQIDERVERLFERTIAKENREHAYLH